MNITITIDCSKYNKKKYDIAVNSDQSIIECLKIINDSLNINLDFDNINYCKSQNEKKAVSVYSSFNENSIHTGDILKLI